MSDASDDPGPRPVHDAAYAASIGGRYEQTFPTLKDDEIERLRRFGEPRRYRDGERLFESGKPTPGMSIILRGHVAVTARDGMGRVVPVVDQGPGQFLAEVNVLANHAPALVDGHAEGEVETILIPPAGVRALMVAEPDLGERIMRALVLRRVALLAADAGGPLLIGPPGAAGMVRLQGFLTRNAYPFHLLDPATDPGAAALIAQHAPTPDELPLVVGPSGTVLKNPRESELARELDMAGSPDDHTCYDVAVVGCGPAGLATAVYAASEGLSVVVLDSRAFGGQAGASARIENYFGFPTGITGQALTARAYAQAQKFGAEIKIPVAVAGLDCARTDGAFELRLEGDVRLRARSVVVASGARYRRPAIAGLADFEGRGVWYWASPIEARLCVGQEVVLVGGGNSAGQAAVFLAGQAKKVRMIVRATGLADSMSRYLVERIEANPRIELMTETEVVGLEGDAALGLQRVRWRHRRTGAEDGAAIQNLFLFVGADPATGWLTGCAVRLDRAGFVVTGGPFAADGSRNGSPLESSVPGVFAVGDVRSGSVKRVGGAIGEGAQVVAALHGYLATATVLAPADPGEEVVAGETLDPPVRASIVG